MSFMDYFRRHDPFNFRIGVGIHGKDLTLFYRYCPEYPPYSCDDVDDLVDFYSNIHKPSEWYAQPFSFLDLYNEIQVSRI